MILAKNVVFGKVKLFRASSNWKGNILRSLEVIVLLFSAVYQVNQPSTPTVHLKSNMQLCISLARDSIRDQSQNLVSFSFLLFISCSSYLRTFNEIVVLIVEKSHL